MSALAPSIVGWSIIERRMLRNRLIFLSISTHFSHMTAFRGTVLSMSDTEKVTVLFQGASMARFLNGVDLG
jgi:hypothetical protein